MPRHLIGDAHEWINEIPTVPTHSLAKLQPSQRSWDLYLCVKTECNILFNYILLYQFCVSHGNNLLFIIFFVTMYFSKLFVFH